MVCYSEGVNAKRLIDAMKRVETWPQAAQEELAGIALEIDTALKGEVYHAMPEELTADCGQPTFSALSRPMMW